MVKSSMNQKGFTSIELLAVVAVITMLTATIVPTYRTYKSRARSSEAKMQLSAAFSSMRGFNEEFGTYHTCLKRMGYSADHRKNLYAVGFQDEHISQSNTDISNCSINLSEQQHFYPQTKAIQGQKNINAATLPSLKVHGKGGCFAIGAAGYVSDSDPTILDRWSIDQDQQLNHIRTGY